MATTYRGYEQYNSVERHMRAKFRRTFPHQNIRVFDIWLKTDRGSFENREVGSLRLTHAAIQWLGERKTWNRFFKGEKFPGQKPLDLLERPPLQSRTNIQYSFPFRGYDHSESGFSRDQYRSSFRGRGRGRGGMGYRGRGSTTFVHNTTAHLLHYNNTLPRATIFCRNCGQDSHPETACPYQVVEEQSRHRERRLTCGKYGHREFEFGEECEACVRNSLRRARDGVGVGSGEEILVGITDPGIPGVRDADTALKKEDALEERMGASNFNGKGEGFTQRPGSENRTGAGEESLIDVSVPDDQDVSDGENAMVIENMLAGIMNGILLDENEPENTSEDESDGNAKTEVGAGEGVLIDVGVPDLESTAKEGDTWIGILSTIDVNVNSARNESARENEGNNGAGPEAREELLIDLEVLERKSAAQTDDTLVPIGEGTNLIGNWQESFSENECEEVADCNGDYLIQF